MVLVTGPTGSGKTNTLYSSIAKINTPETNIMTAEDPVEFNLAGINQVQVKENIGLNFAAALRSFLRQDPNIILVGEIRDFETAENRGQGGAHRPPRAVDAAHQRRAEHDQPLDEHGHRAVLVASSVHLICAQRLVRRVCSGLQGGRIPMPPRRSCRPGSRRRTPQAVTPMKAARAASAATTPATRAASALYE
jgi:type IV pilus assembly protein PilB